MRHHTCCIPRCKARLLAITNHFNFCRPCPLMAISLCVCFQWSEHKKASYVKHSVREYHIHKELQHPRCVFDWELQSRHLLA